MIQGGDFEEINDSQRLFNGKNCRILRATGCSCIIVNRNLVENEDSIDEYNLLETAVMNNYRVLKTIIKI